MNRCKLKRVSDLPTAFGRNCPKMGTSRAPVAVSKIATRTIVNSANVNVSQCGRTYFKRRRKSFIRGS